MNPELEALIKALDAYLEAVGSEAERLHLVYQARLEGVVSHHADFPNLLCTKPSNRRTGAGAESRTRLRHCHQRLEDLAPSPNAAQLAAACRNSPEFGFTSKLIAYSTTLGTMRPVVVTRIQIPRELNLFEVVLAYRRLRRGLGVRQCGQQQARQNADDGDDDQQFDQGEASAECGMRNANWAPACRQVLECASPLAL